MLVDIKTVDCGVVDVEIISVLGFLLPGND